MKKSLYGALIVAGCLSAAACSTMPYSTTKANDAMLAECEDQKFSVFFETGVSTLNAANEADLASIASASDSCPAYTVRLAGYADSVGDSAENTDLSERRARSVLDALTDGGVSATRVVITPVGERAAVTNETANAYLRRVTVVMDPVVQ